MNRGICWPCKKIVFEHADLVSKSNLLRQRDFTQNTLSFLVDKILFQIWQLSKKWGCFDWYYDEFPWLAPNLAISTQT